MRGFVHLASLVLFSSAAGTAFGGSARVGGEFQINSSTSGSQLTTVGRAAARTASGGFVVVWTDGDSGYDGSDGARAGVFGKRFDAAGVPLGTEFQVNTYTTFSQHRPAVSAAGDGSFVVVWQSGDQFETQDGSGAGVFGQRFDVAGQPVGTEFQINSYTNLGQRSPDVAAASDGRFAVVWVDDGYALNGRDKSGAGVFARLYDTDGSPLDDAFRVNSYTRFDQEAAAVAVTDEFEIIVTWQSEQQDGSGTGVFARRYDPNGKATNTEFQVNTYTVSAQRQPDVAFGAANATSLPQNSFVVAWESLSQDGSQSGIFAKRFNGTGANLGTEFRVNAQTAAAQTHPSIARDATGEFVIAWNSINQDGDDIGIFGRAFSVNGTPDGLDFQVNAFTVGSQLDATPVAADASGDFAIVWVSEGQDGDEEGVVGQWFCKDADNDTVCNPVDICPAGNDLVDSDSDSVPDACDECPGFDDALNADGDGVPDGCDVCPGFDDATDPDNDDVPTGCDVCPRDAADDADGDGYCRNAGFLAPMVGDNDNCPTTSNPSQADTDADSVGDSCDLCPGFDDLVNPDGDGVPTGCDPCPTDKPDDTDGDGYCRGAGFLSPKIGDNDNCPSDANPLQENVDGDAKGDACDPCPADNPDDGDNDNVCNSVDTCVSDQDNDEDGDGYCANTGFIAPRIGDNDNCPEVANTSQADGDGDGSGDACDICTNVSGARTINGSLRVNLRDVGEANTPDNDDRLLVRGEITLPMTSNFSTAIDPVHDLVHIAIDTENGTRKVDITLPNDVYGGVENPGWTLTANGTRWLFRDRTGAASGANGISSIAFKDRSDLEPRLVQFKIRGSGGNYPIKATDVPITFRLRVGPATVDCGEKGFTPEQCVYDDDHRLDCEN